jgi:hypothetical protein
MNACTSCSREKVVINLENYYWNSKHAVYSRFMVKNDLLYLKEDWIPFSGTIQLNQGGKPELIYTIEEGNIVLLEITKNNEEGTYHGKYVIKDSEAKMQSKSEFQNLTTITQWTCNSFTNKDFIEGTIEDRDSESLILIKKDGKTVESKIKIRKENNIKIKELTSRNHDGGEVLINIASFKKMLKDSVWIEVDFTEHPGLGDVLHNSLNDIYSETIKVSKGPGSIRMKISYSQDKDIILFATLENMEGKFCKDLDFLHADKQVVDELLTKRTSCVSDGLLFYNSITGKSISREKVKERFMKKIKSNRLLTKTPEDISFYF